MKIPEQTIDRDLVPSISAKPGAQQMVENDDDIAEVVTVTKQVPGKSIDATDDEDITFISMNPSTLNASVLRG